MVKNIIEMDEPTTIPFSDRLSAINGMSRTMGLVLDDIRTVNEKTHIWNVLTKIDPGYLTYSRLLRKID